MEETHEFVPGRRTGNSYLASGNPRNPGTNSHGPLSRVNSILLASHTDAPSTPFSPGFLFCSLFSINVFSFPRSQNFLIISAKMRDCVSLSLFLFLSLSPSLKLNAIRLVLFVLDNGTILTAAPIDRRILFTQHCLFGYF